MEATINKEDIDVPKSQLMDFDVYKVSKNNPFYFIYVSLATGERMRAPMKIMHIKDWPKDEPVAWRQSYYYASCSDMGWTLYQGYHDPLAIERVFLVPPVSCPEHVMEALKTLRDLDVPVKLSSYGNVEIEKRANPCGEIEMSPRARTQIGSPHNVDSHTDEDLAARGKRKTAEASLMFEICAFDKMKARTVVDTLRQLGFESDESAKSCLLAIDNKIKELNALRDVVKEMQ
jgi:hypothetical protein